MVCTNIVARRTMGRRYKRGGSALDRFRLEQQWNSTLSLEIEVGGQPKKRKHGRMSDVRAKGNEEHLLHMDEETKNLTMLILEREGILEELRRCRKAAEVVDGLAKLKPLTEDIVEKTNSWQVDRQRRFLWNGKRYLLKIVEDLNFLASSQPGLPKLLGVQKSTLRDNPLMAPKPLSMDESENQQERSDAEKFLLQEMRLNEQEEIDKRVAELSPVGTNGSKHADSLERWRSEVQHKIDAVADLWGLAPVTSTSKEEKVAFSKKGIKLRPRTGRGHRRTHKRKVKVHETVSTVADESVLQEASAFIGEEKELLPKDVKKIGERVSCFQVNGNFILSFFRTAEPKGNLLIKLYHMKSSREVLKCFSRVKLLQIQKQFGIVHRKGRVNLKGICRLLQTKMVFSQCGEQELEIHFHLGESREAEFKKLYGTSKVFGDKKCSVRFFAQDGDDLLHVKISGFGKKSLTRKQIERCLHREKLLLKNHEIFDEEVILLLLEHIRISEEKEIVLEFQKAPPRPVAKTGSIERFLSTSRTKNLEKKRAEKEALLKREEMKFIKVSTERRRSETFERLARTGSNKSLRHEHENSLAKASKVISEEQLAQTFRRLSTSSRKSSYKKIEECKQTKEQKKKLPSKELVPESDIYDPDFEEADAVDNDDDAKKEKDQQQDDTYEDDFE